MKTNIIKFNEIASLGKTLRKEGKKIVLCHGVFDILHLGHINYFEESKSQGDVLIVSLTDEKFIKKYPRKPIFSNTERMQVIASLKCVDYVVCNSNTTAINIIKILRPSIYSKGPDYKNTKLDKTGEIINEINAVKKVGGKFYTTSGKIFSSSSIANLKFSNYENDIIKVIEKVKKKYVDFKKIENEIDKIKNKKILIIGEAIIDEYNYCEAIGKSGKEAILNYKSLSKETFIGGALAIANHISDFCKSVTILCGLGRNSSFEKLIKKNLKHNVILKSIKFDNYKTILKRRLIENIDKKKILGLYDIDENFLDKKQCNKVFRELKNLMPKNDLLMVADYNHGLINDKIANYISIKAKNKYNLMSQLNSGSFKQKGLSKYKNPNWVIINQKELFYEMRSDTNREQLMKKFCEEFNCLNLIITRGKNGMNYYDKRNSTYSHIDAFTTQSIDKIGSGDAVYAITSLLGHFKIDKDLILLIGTIAGYFMVNIIANEKFLDKRIILNQLSNLIK